MEEARLCLTSVTGTIYRYEVLGMVWYGSDRCRINIRYIEATGATGGINKLVRHH